MAKNSQNQQLPPCFRVDLPLYRIHLISDSRNPSLKTTEYSLHIPLILFRSDDSLLTDTSFGKIKVSEFNTPKRIRLKKKHSPAYASTPAGSKSPGLLKTYWNVNFYDASDPHHPTVELESAHSFPHKGNASQPSPIVLSFLFQGQQPLYEENMQT